MDFTESDSAPRGDLPKPPGFSESSSLDTVRRAPCNRTRPGLSRRVPRTGPRGCQEGTGGPDTAQAEEGEGALLVTWKELHDDGLHARTPLGPPPMRPQLGVRRVLIPCAVDEREWRAHILDNDHLLRHLQPHQVGLHRQHRCTYCTYPPTDHRHAAAGRQLSLGSLPRPAWPHLTLSRSLSAFVRFEDPKMSVADKTSLFGYKVMFVLMNLLAMSGALYKMSLMGLLPTTASDWVGFISVPPAAQVATGSVIG